MKFWKILSYLILQTLPDWRDKFISYKHLKKQLKLIYPNSLSPTPTLSHHHHHRHQSDDSTPPIKRPRFTGGDERESDGISTSKEVNDFVSLLEVEIEKFNSFVVEKEEEYVIRWRELQDRLAEASNSNDELMRVGREIVDFHGEMVLLENYSALNYTGLVKILKKYDKRSGALIRLPFIQKLLHEPFYSNDTLLKLVRDCEATLDRLFSQNEQISSHTPSLAEASGSNLAREKKKEHLLAADKELEEIEQMENMYMKLTLSALRALKDLRGGSSTVNEFSLPPLDRNPVEEEMHKKNLFIEQAAK